MACLKHMHALTVLALIVSGLNLQAKVPDSFYRDYPDAYLKETKAEHDARMAWWREARLGLFIHWGLYCIPAGEWKGKESKKHYAEWTMHNHEIPLEEYSALAKQFNPVNFNADEWAELAKRAGMGYFVLTTKHHDGFAMFDSDVSDYNMVGAPVFSSISIIRVEFTEDGFSIAPVRIREEGARVGLECRFGKSRGNKMAAMRHRATKDGIVINLSAGNPNADEHVAWDFEVDKPGMFKVVLECVEPAGQPRDRIVNIRIGEGNELEAPATAGSLMNGEIILGEIMVPEIKPPQLELRVNERVGGPELLLKAIRLERKE